MAALPDYFEHTTDPVDDQQKIRQIEPIHLEDERSCGVDLEAICLLRKNERIPRRVYLRLTSISSLARFDENSDFSYRIDSLPRKECGKLDVKQQHNKDYDVIEIMVADVTLEEFKQMAWAEQLYFKVGYKTMLVNYSERQKWKMLWKYFDLRRLKDEAKMKHESLTPPE